jgi:hypothetical protein
METNKYSRRDFLASGITAGALIPASALLPGIGLEAMQSTPEGETVSGASTVLDVDFQKLVSRADLDYTEPVQRSEEGQPVGNGRMGSLVWTTPAALRFQINRVDVYAENRDTNSFPERHTDYGSGCGHVDIDFCDFGEDVFAAPGFHQHLSVYDGVVTVKGNGVSARVLACRAQDVMAVEIDDQRAQPEPLHVDLRMLRYVMQYIVHENYELARRHSIKVSSRNHSATSTLGIRDGRIVLVQEFREGNYYNASAVAIAVVGREAKAKYANDSTVRLGVAAARGSFTILIAGSSSFHAEEDVAAKALAALDATAGQSFAALLTAHRSWWHGFWSRAFVRMESPDQAAHQVEQNYTYYLYVMGASSGGDYIPRFGGMLWLTNGDMRQWGAQHWWHNAGCNYNALPVANRPELMHPFLSMYSAMYESSAVAARQQWGSEGIFIPETSCFDGLETLPDDIAAEMRELYLISKPWEQRSEAFRYCAEPKMPHNSRWNWKDKGEWKEGHFVWRDRGYGPFGPVTHILSSGAKIAHLYWQHYEHIQDEAFLRERAYPMVKGIAEFYRNFPNLRLGDDGRYHIHHVNNHEPVFGARDTQEEIAAIRGILPVAIKGAEMLQVDAELRMRWTELLQKLAPLPTNALPDSPRARKAGEPELWIAGLPPVVRGEIAALKMIPALHYDLCSVETEDEAMRSIGMATFAALYPTGVNASTPVPELSTDATAAAHLGRGEDMRHLLPNQLLAVRAERAFCDWPGSGPPAILANRMTLREGPGAIGVERLGRMAEAMHACLLQSNPAKPGGDPVVHVFPAWPKDWAAQYTLSARGGFVVTSSWRQERVEFVELYSRAGRACQLRNPWGAGKVALYRNGRRAESVEGALLRFTTQKQETVIVVPAGMTPAQFKRLL